MLGRWLWKQQKQSEQSVTVQIPEMIHSADAMRPLLEVERMRSDRSGQPFCMVSFKLPPAQQQACDLNALLDVLQSSIRMTDHAGFLERYEVAVILWHTGVAGASQFAEKVLNRLPQSVQPAVCVYCYPKDQFPNSPGRGTGRPASRDAMPVHAEDVCEALPCVSVDEISTESRVTSCLSALEELGNLLNDENTSDAATSQQTKRVVRPLADLFVRPIPAWKRTLDIVGAGFGLVLLSPVLLLTAAAIKWTSPGPILFFQDRTGHGGRRFRMVKFRSMVTDAEARKRELMKLNQQDGPAFKIEGDPRITPIGRLIRASSIDELPQLWNVLRGDMTLVGPRPLPCSEASACATWQHRRLDVTPGLTCIWQTKDRRNKIPFADWVRMDIQYIGKRTVKTDLSLILQTARVVLMKRGI